MKFEKKTEEIAPFKVFLFRIFRYILFSTLLIFASVCIGTLGYHHLAHISWVDSFHMACMILTGMGPVAEMPTEQAKIFSSLYALYSGVAFLSITAVLFAPLIHRILHILHVEDETGKKHLE